MEHLDTWRELLVSQVEAEGFTVFHGWLEGEGLPIVYWDVQVQEDVHAFLSVAKTHGVSTLLVHSEVFDERFLTYRDGRLDVFRRRLGEACWIDLCWINHGIVYIYRKTADWHDRFNEVLDEIEAEMVDREFEHTERARWLRERGWTLPQIAHDLGLPKDRVRRLLEGS